MEELDHFIIFKLGSEDFGVEIIKVQEIIKPQKVTALPKVEDFIEGIIDLRGEIITIIDLRKRLDFKIDDDIDSRIMIVKVNDINVGFVVDDASEVIRIANEKINNPSKGVAGVRTEFIEGIANIDSRLIVILDLDNLLTTTEKVMLEEVSNRY